MINLASLYLAGLHIFGKLVHAFHWRQPLKCLLVVKQLWKFRFQGQFSKAKTEGCEWKVGNVFDPFGIPIPCSATCFLQVGARVSLKVTTKQSIRDKKDWKIGFLGYFSKAKMEECDLKSWIIFDQFGITIPCLATYFVEVGARLSLKVATKGSIRDKNTLKI